LARTEAKELAPAVVVVLVLELRQLLGALEEYPELIPVRFRGRVLQLRRHGGFPLSVTSALLRLLRKAQRLLFSSSCDVCLLA